MRITTKLVSVAAAAALVAGSGIAVAESASAVGATTTIGGKSIVSLKKDTAAKMKAAGITMTATPPSKVTASQIGFDISGANGREIYHNGAVTFKGPKGSVTLANAVITYAANQKTGTLYASIGGIETAIATIGHVTFNTWTKTDTTHATKIVRTYRVWKGTANLTGRSTTVAALNAMLGTNFFRPGMGLGRTRTTEIISVEG